MKKIKEAVIIEKEVNEPFHKHQQEIQIRDTKIRNELPTILDLTEPQDIPDLIKIILEHELRTSYDLIDEAIIKSKHAERWEEMTEDDRRELHDEMQTAFKLKEKPKEVKKDLSVISFKVSQYLLLKQRREATELIVKTFLKDNIVHTTRHDNNPEMYIYINGIHKQDAQTYIKEYCESILDEALTTTLTNEVLFKIEVRTYIADEDFFKIRDINKIAVQNGVLDLQTGELLENSPDYYFFNKLPVMYDKKAKCPSIKQFFKDILRDESDLKVIQEMIGYILLKENRFEKAFMFTGTGRNGKSKLVELIKRFIGIDNCVNIPLNKFESDPYSVGHLFNKMANLGADISGQYLKDLSEFKGLVSRDLTTSQRKFLNNISFVNYAKMIFCANELPDTREKTKAIWERWILLDFIYMFVSKKEYDLQKDKTNYKIANENIIEDIITQKEMSGLLNFAFEGLIRLIDQKYFSYNKSTAEVEDIWLRRSSSLNAFVKDMIETSYDDYIEKQIFQYEYARYCREHDIQAEGDKKIKSVLTKLGVYETRPTIEAERVYVLNGIKLKSVQPVQPVQRIHTSREKTKNPIGVNNPDCSDCSDGQNTLIDENVKIEDLSKS